MRDYGPIAELIGPYMDRPRLSGSRNLASKCPFPDHDDNSPSFAVNIENGLWKCHGCNRSGGLVTLLRELGLSRSRVDQLVDPILPRLEKHRRKERRKRANRFLRDQFLADMILPESLLGVYDWKPNGLVDQGFEPKLLRELEVGYDKGKDRITFPLRDFYGNLVGLMGRATIHEDKPRYMLYRGRRKNDVGRFVPSDYGPEFDEQFPTYKIEESHKYLWNVHRVYPLMLAKFAPLIVVEGFKACIWLIQNGFWNTVALMGSGMSQEQHDMICRMSGNRIILFLDNDNSGIKGTLRIGKWLRKSTSDVWVCSYPEWAEQPDDFSGLGLNDVFSQQERFGSWTRMMSRA